MFLCSNRKVFCSISHLVPLFSVRLGYSQPGFERKDLFQSWSGVLSQPTTGQVLFNVFSVEMISQAWLLCPGRTPVLHAPQAGTGRDGGKAPTPGEFTGWPEREPAVKVMGHWTGLKSSTRKAVLFERFRSKTFKFRGTLTGEGKSAQWGSRAPSGQPYLHVGGTRAEEVGWRLRREPTSNKFRLNPKFKWTEVPQLVLLQKQRTQSCAHCPA